MSRPIEAGTINNTGPCAGVVAQGQEGKASTLAKHFAGPS